MDSKRLRKRIRGLLNGLSLLMLTEGYEVDSLQVKDRHGKWQETKLEDIPQALEHMSMSELRDTESTLLRLMDRLAGNEA